jgi:hypothetical protein
MNTAASALCMLGAIFAGGYWLMRWLYYKFPHQGLKR